MTKWINYTGTDQVHGADGEVLTPESRLFVATKFGGKMNAVPMTVAEMVARRNDRDYPELYRVAEVVPAVEPAEAEVAQGADEEPAPTSKARRR